MRTMKDDSGTTPRVQGRARREFGSRGLAQRRVASATVSSTPRPKSVSCHLANTRRRPAVSERTKKSTPGRRASTKRHDVVSANPETARAARAFADWLALIA